MAKRIAYWKTKSVYSEDEYHYFQFLEEPYVVYYYVGKTLSINKHKLRPGRILAKRCPDEVKGIIITPWMKEKIEYKEIYASSFKLNPSVFVV